MRVGLDRLADHPPLSRRLAGARVALLSHAASVDRHTRHALEVLAEQGIAPALLFAPEHGFVAAAQDMAAIADARDPQSGARIVSLYGAELDDLVPRAEHLADVDVLLVDLGDVGARYYTYVWTALFAARAAAAAGVHTVLLDRPNPLGGVAVEGRLQRPGYTSFVGWERVPIRHGLTLAELVCLWTPELELGPSGALGVVPVAGWDRALTAPHFDRPWVQPSPNMPTFDTALVYPGGCLIEGTNLSEGRGHTRPFEVVGAPWIDGRRLARELMGLGLGGFVARPLGFTPTFHKHAGQVCGGVQIHVTHPRSFEAVATYTALVALCRAQDPERFRFRTERYEFVDDIPAFDLLTGSAETREAILAGEPPRDVARALSRVDADWQDRAALAHRRCRQASYV